MHYSPANYYSLGRVVPRDALRDPFRRGASRRRRTLSVTAVAAAYLPLLGPGTLRVDDADFLAIDPYRGSALVDDAGPLAVDPYRATFST